MLGTGQVGAQDYQYGEELKTMVDKTDKINTMSTAPAPVTTPEITSAAKKTGKTRPKRLSKSKRIHQRRLKQAARKPGAAGS